jgi:hypothetical protein
VLESHTVASDSLRDRLTTSTEIRSQDGLAVLGFISEVKENSFCGIVGDNPPRTYEFTREHILCYPTQNMPYVVLVFGLVEFFSRASEGYFRSRDR